MTKPHLHIIHDEFKFEDEPKIVERSRHTWRFGVRDEHGHFEKLHLKYPENYLPRIMKIVGHEATEFNSAQDFVRNAMYHYMLFMSEWLQDPELSELMEITKQQAKVDKRREEIHHRTQLITSAVESITETLEAQDWDELRNAISDGQEIVATSRVNAEPLVEAIKQAQEKLDNHA